MMEPLFGVSVPEMPDEGPTVLQPLMVPVTSSVSRDSPSGGPVF